MNNSRSQTKIRKTQQVNLLAEQRYFRQKSLITENMDNLFLECFYNYGLLDTEIPTSCKSVTNMVEFNKCKNDINSAILKKGLNIGTPETTLFSCLEQNAYELINTTEDPSSEEEEEEPSSEEEEGMF